MIRCNSQPRRAGFTLIEVLITITIIALLATLTIVGIGKAFSSAKRAQASSEVNELAVACTKFKTDFGFYPPAGFTVPTASNPADPSYALLRRMFPRWDGDLSVLGSWTQSPPGTTLDSNQCLVVFLGGPTQTGWNPAAPTPPGGNTRKGPYFDFPATRLLNPDTGNYDLHFRDPWKVAYAYFVMPYANNPPFVNPDEPGNSVQAYQQAGKFVNFDGIQIISAGPDELFGPGGDWVPGQGPYSDVPPNPGADDIANFNGGTQLGFKP